MLRIYIGLIMSVCAALTCSAQKISYSQPDRDDVKTMSFDIIGKLEDHYLIHKNIRTDHKIAIYDSSMKEIAQQDLDFLPTKVLSTDILTYRDFFYMFYQYQKKNIVYCMAAKIDANGKLVGEPRELDTTAINFFSNDKLYSIISSDNKQKIMVFKINSKNPEKSILTTSLFDPQLNLIHKSHIAIPMPDRNGFLSEFVLDNDGQFVFVKPVGTSQQDNITEATLVAKNPEDDTLGYFDLPIPHIYLDDIKIKVDNNNQRFVLTSFYSKTKRGNIEGLYAVIWDKNLRQAIATSNTTFSEEVRSDAKSEGNAKSAFNDFYVQNIVVRKDGGYVVAAESVYSSSRGVYNNRWDYASSYPFTSPYNYYYYSWNSPFYYNNYYYPWWRWGSMGSQMNRFYADNIAVMSFDSSASMQWINVIHKSQFDDFTDNFIGYGTLNTGDQFHFLFNQLEKRTLLLTDQSITPDGQVIHSPTLRNLERDYQFMPHFAKQVSGYEVIIPCQYRNYICFAKVEI